MNFLWVLRRVWPLYVGQITTKMIHNTILCTSMMRIHCIWVLFSLKNLDQFCLMNLLKGLCLCWWVYHNAACTCRPPCYQPAVTSDSSPIWPLPWKRRILYNTGNWLPAMIHCVSLGITQPDRQRHDLTNPDCTFTQTHVCVCAHRCASRFKSFAWIHHKVIACLSFLCPCCLLWGHNQPMCWIWRL